MWFGQWRSMYIRSDYIAHKNPCTISITNSIAIKRDTLHREIWSERNERNGINNEDCALFHLQRVIMQHDQDRKPNRTVFMMQQAAGISPVKTKGLYFIDIIRINEESKHNHDEDLHWRIYIVYKFTLHQRDFVYWFLKFL